MRNENSFETLQNIIESYINIYYVKQKREDIILGLKDRIPVKRMMDVFNRNIPVQLLSEQELYYVLVELNRFHKANKSSLKYNQDDLDVTKYFTEVEITKYLSENLEEEEKDTADEYTFHNVYMVDNKQYMIPAITAREIVDMIYKNLVVYDFDVQRESEKKTFNGVSYERVKIFRNSIAEIKKSMKAHAYRPTALSINILDRSGMDVDGVSGLSEEDLKPHFVYNEEEHTLTISAKDRNSLIDGMHRLYALMECCNEDEHFSQIMQLNIFHLDLTDARQYVYQEGQKNAISKETLRKYNSADTASLMANEIEQSGSKARNFLQGRLGNDKEDVIVMDKFTTFGKLAEAIGEQFGAVSMEERFSVNRYIVRFFTEVIGHYHKEFADIKESRKTSYATHWNMVYAYIYLAKALQDKEDWEMKLEDILKKLDMRIDKGNMSQFLNYKTYDMNKRHRNLMYKKLSELM